MPTTDHPSLISQPLFAGYGTCATVTDQRIPLLTEALLAVGPQSYFDIDVKHPHELEAIANKLHAENLQFTGSLKIDTQTAADIQTLLGLQEKYGAVVMAKVDLPNAGLNHIIDLKNAGVAAAELWFDDLDDLQKACAVAGNDMAISTYTLDAVHCCGLSDAQAKKTRNMCGANCWGLVSRSS